MAYALVKISDSYNSGQHKEYVLDSVTDATSLPDITECAPGSTAATPDGTTFIMTPSGNWSTVVASSGTIHQYTPSTYDTPGTSDGTASKESSDDMTLFYSSEITTSCVDASGTPLFEVEVTVPTDKTYGALYAIIEDKNGQRNGYFYKSETAMIISDGATTTSARGVYASVVNQDGTVSTYSYGGSAIAYGIFISSMNRDSNTIKIYARYNSTQSRIISGTYSVDVYGVPDIR